VLKDFGFNSDRIESIADSFDNESGKIFLSETHRIIKDRKHLIISSISSVAISELLIGENQDGVNAEGLMLQISQRNAKDFLSKGFSHQLP